MKTTVLEHRPVAIVHETDSDLEPPARGKPPPIGFSPLDRLSALAHAHGEGAALDDFLKLIVDSAAWLAGPDGDASRRRMLSRLAAGHKGAVDLLQASIGARLEAGDLQGALALDRLATGATKRLVLFLTQLERETAGDRQQPVVAVGVAQNVIVKANR